MKHITSSFFRQYRQVLLSLSIALLAASCLQLILTLSQHEQIYWGQVQQNMETLKQEAERKISETKQVIKETGKISFSDLLKATGGSHILIFNDRQQAIFWSSAHHAIPYEKLRGFYRQRCIAHEGTFFYVQKSLLTLYNQDYEILSLTPLFLLKGESTLLPSGSNMAVFLGHQAELSFHRKQAGEQLTRDIFISPGQQYLFTARLYELDFRPMGQLTTALIYLCVAAFIGGLGYALCCMLRNAHRRDSYWQGVGILLLGMGALRLWAHLFQVPRLLSDLPLFEQRGFQYGTLSFSASEIVANQLYILLLLFYVLRYFHRLLPLRAFMKLQPAARIGISLALQLSSFGLLFWLSASLLDLCRQTGGSLDFYEDFYLHIGHLTCLLSFLLCAGVFFFYNHLVLRLLDKLLPKGRQLALLSATTLLLLWWQPILVAIQAAYLCVCLLAGLAAHLRQDKYSAFSYVILFCVASALLGARYSAISRKERNLDRQDYYANFLMNNEELTEAHLIDLVEHIKDDRRLRNWMGQQSALTTEHTQRLRADYLREHFYKYEASLFLLDSGERDLLTGKPLSELLGGMQAPRPERVHKYIQVYSEEYTSNRIYVCKVPIQHADGRLLGHLLLQMKTKLLNGQLSQELWVNTFENMTWMREQYSCAIYYRGSLLYSNGKFNYDKGFSRTVGQQLRNSYRHEFSQGDFDHLHVANGMDKQIIVSAHSFGLQDFMANFSFVFSLLVFTSLCLYLGMKLYSFRFQGRQMSFFTKAQLYLNFAFILPLLIVSLVILSVMSDLNKREVEARYLEKANEAATHLFEKVVYFQQGRIDEEALRKEVHTLANFLQSDVRLYGPDGRMLLTNAEQMMGTGFMSEYINPQAMAEVVEQKTAQALLVDKAGKLLYNTAYASLRALDTGEVLGVVGLPFFQSAYKLDKMVVEVVSVIMEVFTAIFLILMPLSYLSARALVRPFKLIVAKIRSTNFVTDNEPLQYEGRDEFAWLIWEYNQMLLKLEESKKALARSEKESAWRDLAKQVVHEIKNPLTPMRLTLQQLQRVMYQQQQLQPAEGEPTPEQRQQERFLRSLEMLLGQVDTLNDIATSFSSFARMPLPKEERFDIAKVLREAIMLYRAKEEEGSYLQEQVPEGRCFVVGDEQLIGRIFSNLIINGIQSVPEGRTPHIRVQMQWDKQKVRISIADNGSGIPEEIQPKVFMLNFTTKVNGSGIGLALAKRGVEHSGGNIWFETRADIGTVFYLELPLSGRRRPSEN